MSHTFRCDCPFTSAIDVVGDKWMLVIVKLMLLEGKKTFKDFIESEEHIATNILSAKLKLLEELGIITKSKLPNNKKTNLYLLTDRGLALTPILLELAVWSNQQLRDLHPTILDGEGLKRIREDKSGFTQWLIEHYRSQHEGLLHAS